VRSDSPVIQLAGMCVSDFVYSNPPLVEVIAEICWQTVPLDLMPGAAIDVFYPDLANALLPLMEKEGYGSVEHVAPPTIPQWMLAGKPVQRFRLRPEVWPVYQIGPGLFACNHVPPYEGWAAVQKTLRAGISMLEKSWPSRDPIKLARLRLRYIDAFSEQFGYEHDASFLATSLALGKGIDTAILKNYSKNTESAHISVQTQFNVDALTGTTATISCSTGQTAGGPAYVADFLLELDCDKSATTLERSMDWFDAAHNVVREIFHSVVSDNLRAKFGDKRMLVTK
jgi:uncharacterized protein (TIGR04255 family)